MYNLEGLESRWNVVLSFDVIIFLILMQESRRGPPAHLLTNEEDSHPFAADQDGLEPEVNACASARQSHATTSDKTRVSLALYFCIMGGGCCLRHLPDPV